MKSTKSWANWWAGRKIDWKTAYLDTWDHPHRFLISAALKEFPWVSLFEVGCGPGPNLVNIVKNFPDKQVGGCDVNPEAVALAQKTFHNAVLKVCPGDNIMMSDDSVDVVLTDMCLIYAGPWKINKYIGEIRRIARNYAVFCEFHSKNPLKKLKLWLTSGYFAHDYSRLLQKQGFYDIVARKIPLEAWPGGEPQKTFGYIITAKVPKYKQ